MNITFLPGNSHDSKNPTELNPALAHLPGATLSHALEPSFTIPIATYLHNEIHIHLHTPLYPRLRMHCRRRIARVTSIAATEDKEHRHKAAHPTKSAGAHIGHKLHTNECAFRQQEETRLHASKAQDSRRESPFSTETSSSPFRHHQEILLPKHHSSSTKEEIYTERSSTKCDV